MELYLKITVGLLLFVHLASLQLTTDSPGRTIDKSWLRDLLKNTAGSQPLTDNEEDLTGMGSSSGTPSGYNALNFVEVVNVTHHDGNTTSKDISQAPNGTTIGPEFTVLNSTTPVPTNSNQTNAPRNENSTVTPPTSTVVVYTNTSTRSPDLANHTEPASTTSAPQNNATQEQTTKLTNSTGSNRTTNATTPVINVTSTTITTESSSVAVTSTALSSPGVANKEDKDAALGSSSDRGFASDPPSNKRYVEWATVLGTMVAVTLVGLAAFIILRNRQNKGFSHRKLVEEYPSDPVLRLDNSEPLDLNFGGSGHYNHGLQGDNIQMTNFPGRH